MTGSDNDTKYITLAIHTLEYARNLKALLESEGIHVELHNVDLQSPAVYPGVRVRISENDLPYALRIVENRDIFSALPQQSASETEVLVPVDFTPHSDEASVIAMNLAKAHGLKVKFIHTYIDPARGASLQLSDAYSFDPADDEVSTRLRQVETKAMDRFARQLKEMIKQGKCAAAKFATRTSEGVPEEVIVRTARETNPFIIVMGTRSARRKESELIGSVSAEVLDNCRTTALTIPAGCEGFRIENVSTAVFLASGDQTDIMVLDALARLCPEQHVKIEVALIERRFHSADSATVAKALGSYSNLHFPNFNVSISSASPEENIERLNSSHDTLLLVPNKKKNILSRIFYPGAAHRILFKSDIPMMVVPV